MIVVMDTYTKFLLLGISAIVSYQLVFGESKIASERGCSIALLNYWTAIAGALTIGFFLFELLKAIF